MKKIIIGTWKLIVRFAKWVKKRYDAWVMKSIKDHFMHWSR